MDTKVTQRISKIFTQDALLRLDIPVKSTKFRGFDIPSFLNWISPNKIEVLKLKPMSVGTMYRTAQLGQEAEHIPEEHLLSIVDAAGAISLVRDAAAVLLSNTDDLPDQDLLAFIEDHLTLQDIQSIVITAVVDTGINDIYEYYALLETCSRASSKSAKKPLRSDFIPHRGFGQILAYFKGAFSEFDLKWKTSWNNYMLYMGSIAGPSEVDLNTESKPVFKELQPANWC